MVKIQKKSERRARENENARTKHNTEISKLVKMSRVFMLTCECK